MRATGTIERLIRQMVGPRIATLKVNADGRVLECTGNLAIAPGTSGSALLEMLEEEKLDDLLVIASGGLIFQDTWRSGQYAPRVPAGIWGTTDVFVDWLRERVATCQK